MHGRKKCEGFQLDPADPCNVQYYLFCEQAPLSMHTFSMCLYVRPVHLVCTLSTLSVRILTLLPLFCEQLFKTAAQSWCPSPAGYPKHCCYAEALKEMDGGREVTPHRYLGQVFPDTPVFK